MNPFVQQVLGGIARAAIVWVAAKFGQTVSDTEATRIFVTYLVPAAVMLWSVWQKYRSQQKLVTAAAAGKSVSVQQVENTIANGGAASVLTPKAAIPQ